MDVNTQVSLFTPWLRIIHYLASTFGQGHIYMSALQSGVWLNIYPAQVFIYTEPLCHCPPPVLPHALSFNTHTNFTGMKQ